MSITLSNCSIPSILLCAPGIVLARFSFLANVLYKISLVSELFPEPDTPVTQVITPSKHRHLCFSGYFLFAPLIVRYPVGFLRSSGTGICILPLR